MGQPEHRERFATWGTADLRPIGLPVFSLGSIPKGRRRLDDRPDDALGSSTVGDWTVGRDDVVLSDDEGVLFVPAARAEELLDIAERIRDTERRQADRMPAGESLRRQVRFDGFLAERERTPTLAFLDHLRAVGRAIEE